MTYHGDHLALPTGQELQQLSCKPGASDRVRLYAAAENSGWVTTRSRAGGKCIAFTNGNRVLDVQFDGNGRIFWLAINGKGVGRDRRNLALRFLSFEISGV